MGIFFGFLIGLPIILIVANQIMSQRNKEWQKDPWQQFARSHNLEFIAKRGLFGNQDYVIGHYQGWFLKLETVRKHQGQRHITCTRISVSTPEHSHVNSNDPPARRLNLGDAIALFTTINSLYRKDSEIHTEPGGRMIYYEQPGILRDPKHLEYLAELLLQLIRAYPMVVQLGSEVVPNLAAVTPQQVLHPLVTELLLDIAHDTTTRLGHRARRLLCPACLTRFAPHHLDQSWLISITYYGCRLCSQSREFYEGLVIATVDDSVNDISLEKDGEIRVNWAARRELFDFDAVEIINATDEEVERFAMQVGNDTDELRKPRYKDMTCVVNPQCGLSENSLRILRRMFGQVEIRRDGDKNEGLAKKLTR